MAPDMPHPDSAMAIPPAPPHGPRSRPRPRHRGRSGAAWAVAAAAAAAAAAATALILYRRARQAERDNPPHGRFMMIGGLWLHYVDRGQGQPVVLLHGNGTMIQDFALSGLLDRLAGRHRVIAFDRPGFGHSTRPRGRLWTPAAQADLLHAALRRLGVERCVLVGHSWGTLVALELAWRHPETVRHLVLMSGYYFPSFRADVLLLSPPAIPVLGDLIRYTLSPPLGRLMLPLILRRLFGPAPVSAGFARSFPFDLALRPWQIRASSAEAAMMIPWAALFRRRLGTVRTPTLILAGAGDRLVTTADQSERLNGVLPQSEFRAIPGAGHMVHHSAPDQVADAIESVARPA